MMHTRTVYSVCPLGVGSCVCVLFPAVWVFVLEMFLTGCYHDVWCFSCLFGNISYRFGKFSGHVHPDIFGNCPARFFSLLCRGYSINIYTQWVLGQSIYCIVLCLVFPQCAEDTAFPTKIRGRGGISLMCEKKIFARHFSSYQKKKGAPGPPRAVVHHHLVDILGYRFIFFPARLSRREKCEHVETGGGCFVCMYMVWKNIFSFAGDYEEIICISNELSPLCNKFATKMYIYYFSSHRCAQ